MTNEPEIILAQKRTPGQRGIFTGKETGYLPEWYCEAEFLGWVRSGEGSTEQEARLEAKNNVYEARNRYFLSNKSDYFR